MFFGTSTSHNPHEAMYCPTNACEALGIIVGYASAKVTPQAMRKGEGAGSREVRPRESVKGRPIATEGGLGARVWSRSWETEYMAADCIVQDTVCRDWHRDKVRIRERERRPGYRQPAANTS